MLQSGIFLFNEIHHLIYIDWFVYLTTHIYNYEFHASVQIWAHLQNSIYSLKSLGRENLFWIISSLNYRVVYKKYTTSKNYYYQLFFLINQKFWVHKETSQRGVQNICYYGQFGNYMLTLQPKFRSNQPKNLMQPFPLPENALHEIWSKLADWL